MFTARIKGRLALTAVAVGAAVALAGCSSADPLGGGDGSSEPGGPIVVGSQAYYSNEIVAEIYAQALENAGEKVERKFQIGQRDVYLAAAEKGEVQVIPEYSGNLLEYYAADTEARSTEDVAAALPDALPDNLTVLDPAEAQDADSYNVTTEFSEENNITSLEDLAGYDGEITVGGNAELESRPYGPEGLKKFYGVDVKFAAIGDGGGPLTQDAITGGEITAGDIYTASPALASGKFVTLDDPKNMILAQNVIPLIASDVSDRVADTLNAVSAKLTTAELIELNAQSVDEQKDSATIAKAWLSAQGLVEG